MNLRKPDGHHKSFTKETEQHQTVLLQINPEQVVPSEVLQRFGRHLAPPQ